MQSYIIKATACAMLFTLAGCERAAAPTPAATANEFTWARAALERNPNLEVIAADTQAGIFTVKIKRTGTTQVIKLNDVVAAPVSELAANQPATVAAPPPAAAAPALPPAAEAPASAQPEPAPFAPPATAVAQLATAPTPTSEKNYTIERTDGKLKVSGPGISIVSSGVQRPTAGQPEAGQRTVEPLICEGQRRMHFDNRSIYVDGNAIEARAGCEIYITNSHIVASGTAVVAAPNSIVHVANSTLEGSAASFDASDGAQMYLRSSTFQGLPRRAEKAVVQDQGGNTWR